MPFDEIDLFDEHLFLLGNDFQDSTTLPLFFSVNDHDQVIFFNMIFCDDHFKFPLLEDFRSQGDDFHKPFGPKFPGNRTENSSSNRIPLWIDEDSRVVIKFDVRTIETLYLFLRPDNDGTSHIPFSNLGIGKGIFD